MFGVNYIYFISTDSDVCRALFEASDRLVDLEIALEGLDGTLYVRTTRKGYTVNVVSTLYKHTFSVTSLEELVERLVEVGTRMNDVIPKGFLKHKLQILASLDNIKITSQVLKDIEDDEILKELVSILVHHDAILGYNGCSVSIYRYSNYRSQISYVLDIRHLNSSAGEDGVQRRKFEFSAKTSVSIDNIRKELGNYVRNLEVPENYEVIRFGN